MGIATEPIESKGSGAASSSAAPPEVAANSITSQIDALRAEQAAIIQNRKRVKKELRNAERKRTRLKSHAKRLSDDDLVQVLRMREESRQQESEPAADADATTQLATTEGRQRRSKASRPADKNAGGERAA